MTGENNKKTAFGFKKMGLVIALFLVVAGVVVYLNLGSIVKTMAEKVGSDTLGVQVSIGRIAISAADKSVTVHGIKIANPEGYSAPHAMNIETVNVKMDSFSKELLVFNDVTVKGSELFLEVNSEGTNLSSLKKNIDRNKKPSAANDVKSDMAPPKVILKHFLLADARLHPTVTLIGGDLADVTVPDIKLTGIGQKTNGVLAKDAVAQIWDEISSSAVKASANAGLLQGISPEGLKDISSSIALPKSLVDPDGGALDKALGGLQGLFGN